MVDGLEPHGTFIPRVRHALHADGVPGWGRGVPGVGRLGVAGRGYTGTQAQPSLGPIFNIYLRLGPTHGQMKVNLRLMMRFPR